MQEHIIDIKSVCGLLRDTLDIVQVITDDVGQPSKKTGQDIWFVCPFHDDHNPSMGVHQQLKIFKCFTCTEGGDIITWTQKFYSLSLVETICKLASKYSVDISKY